MICSSSFIIYNWVETLTLFSPSSNYQHQAIEAKYEESLVISRVFFLWYINENSQPGTIRGCIGAEVVISIWNISSGQISWYVADVYLLFAAYSSVDLQFRLFHLLFLCNIMSEYCVWLGYLIRVNDSGGRAQCDTNMRYLNLPTPMKIYNCYSIMGNTIEVFTIGISVLVNNNF